MSSLAESMGRLASPLLAALCASMSLPSRSAAAPPPRRAVVVGANIGGRGDAPLRFAERDARRVAEALRDVGGVARADLTLLVGASASSSSVLAALGEAQQRAAGGQLVFYYSGHAGLEGLHLQGEVIAWSRLRELTSGQGGPGTLRIVFVDACHAGELARPKGFVTAAAQDALDESQGSAVLAAAQWFEAAQESDAIGGSFFTHALVSGLRGAADADGDGMVTLEELYAFVSRDTSSRTRRTTRLVQHPTYRFDLAGRGDIVMARLRDSDARLILEAPLEGTAVVLEAGSSLVVAEAPKRGGSPLAFALPKGRYVVHLRGSDSVGVAEVSLPWGGEIKVGAASLQARSFLEVALKGVIVDVRYFRLRAGAVLETAPLFGMGFLPSGALSAGAKIGAFELGLRAAAGYRRFRAVDTRVSARVVEGGALLAYEWPLRLVDLRAWGAADLAGWWEAIDGAPGRANVTPAAGLGAGVRVPLWSRWFAEAGLEGRALFPEVQGQGRSARLTLRSEVMLGVVF